jgi:hypothetical protein
MILEEWTGDKLIADTGALAGHGGTALKGSALSCCFLECLYGKGLFVQVPGKECLIIL